MTAHDNTDLSNRAAFGLILGVLALLVALLAACVILFGVAGLGIFGLVATLVIFGVMLAFTAGN
ncbi:hypothetical protein [Paracoccus sp. (in: a-proteobacteria)]|uniref:hypothetical protein n=1 Tax=Paracoccus sp. TaxID=267 RepID=UPI00272AA804|nr:hypothetical protein [Paracoccus sp. (in: a-proteobacteria)]